MQKMRKGRVQDEALYWAKRAVDFKKYLQVLPTVGYGEPEHLAALKFGRSLSDIPFIVSPRICRFRYQIPCFAAILRALGTSRGRGRHGAASRST